VREAGARRVPYPRVPTVRRGEPSEFLASNTDLQKAVEQEKLVEEFDERRDEFLGSEPV
jgi:hypothetical protein